VIGYRQQMLEEEEEEEEEIEGHQKDSLDSLHLFY
jgi:hypothetical protein